MHHARMGRRELISNAAIIAMVIGLPLLGAWLGGRNLHDVFLFPPPDFIPVHYPHFSWTAAALIVAALSAILCPWIAGGRTQEARAAGVKCSRGATPFPWWGWCALAWTLLWWLLAWTRFPWFASLQIDTFFPLWLGFIFSMSALTFRRTGSCQMLRTPHVWLQLFLASG